jgi:ABC-type spermidine/putrescine transport system permease subunit II
MSQHPTPPIAPPAPAPPGGGTAKDNTFDVFAWFEKTEPTWMSLTIGFLVGLGSLAFGLRGLYAYWRGQPSGPMVPGVTMAIGYLVFGAWVIWVFLSRLAS